MIKKISIALLLLFILILTVNIAAPGKVYDTMVSLERSRAGLEKKSMIIEDHTITYLEGGKGEALLLVHGFNGNKDNWTRFARFLTDSYRVIIPDNPGFAESTYLEKGDYTIPAQSKRLALFMARKKIGKFHVAGNSMGGAIAGTMARLYPGSLLSLALFDAAGTESAKKSEFQKLVEKGKNPLVTNRPSDYKKMMEFVFVTPPFIPSPVARYLGEENLRFTEQNQAIFKQIRNNIGSLEKNLEKIATPALVLWGDRDRILDVSGAYIFHKKIKNSQLVIMKDCGHIPMLERPKEAASHYRAFLTSLNKKK